MYKNLLHTGIRGKLCYYYTLGQKKGGKLCYYYTHTVLCKLGQKGGKLCYYYTHTVFSISCKLGHAYKHTKVKLALITVRLTGPVVAVVVSAVTGGGVSAMEVLWAVLRPPGAVLGDVARPADGTTLCPVRSEPTGSDVTAGPSGALGVGGQLTGVGVAALVGTLLKDAHRWLCNRPCSSHSLSDLASLHQADIVTVSTELC